jgi:hypothetical protein
VRCAAPKPRLLCSRAFGAEQELPQQTFKPAQIFGACYLYGRRHCVICALCYELNNSLYLTIGLRNSLFLNESKNARSVLYLMSLTMPGRAFLSLSDMRLFRVDRGIIAKTELNHSMDEGRATRPVPKPTNSDSHHQQSIDMVKL